MIAKPAMVTGLILIAAVLAFAGLAYQTVPVSTTQTVIQESTETGASYSPYLVTNTPAYTTRSVSVITRTSTGGEVGCLYDEYGCTPPYVSVYYSSITFMNTLQSAYEMPSTVVIPYSQTGTSSVTESSTSFVPASAALGLTGGSFTILAVTVIGVLVLLTACVTLIPIMIYRPKQVTLSQSAKAAPSCIKCGAKLPPDSIFCEKCGTKQTG